jgi:hypothetical protein
MVSVVFSVARRKKKLRTYLRKAPLTPDEDLSIVPPCASSARNRRLLEAGGGKQKSRPDGLLLLREGVAHVRGTASGFPVHRLQS